MNYYQYQTVLGLLTICEENDAVIAINVGHYSENKGEKRESELIRRTYKQFVEYLDGKRKVLIYLCRLRGLIFKSRCGRLSVIFLMERHAAINRLL